MTRLISIAFLFLTCLRNNDAVAGHTNCNQDAPCNIRGPPGYPGKRGSPGHEGELGEKGYKGEPFSIEHTGFGVDNLINIRGQLDEALHKIASLCKVVKRLTEYGWYAPSNGYQYKVLISRQSWQESRRLCQDLGGDLAVAGTRNSTTRKDIGNILHHSIRYVWIGLSEIAQEGNWIWINGEV
ncbi:unnamed protein product [Clavelina lepadiformis]|uniref:C-type lectin domain-containing protein n=1 Tax=Clavelina lepadiformis TaxID=159417 RepID=A0ABP0GVU4_CLALP